MFDEMVFDFNHTGTAPNVVVFGGRTRWYIGNAIIRGAIDLAAAGNDHAEYSGVSLAMIEQNMPWALEIGEWGK